MNWHKLIKNYLDEKKNKKDNRYLIFDVQKKKKKIKLDRNSFGDILYCQSEKKEIDVIKENIDCSVFTTDQFYDIVDKIKINKEISSDKKKEKIEDNEKNMCQTCNSLDTIVEDSTHGYYVCKNCGSTIQNVIDSNGECRNYGQDDNRGENHDHYGAPTNPYFANSALGTSISGVNSHMKRIHSWNMTVYKDRTFKEDIQKITSICEKHGIKKNIYDIAIFLWKKNSEYKHKEGKNKDKNIIIRGYNRLGIMAACLSYACTLNSTPKNIKEISKIFEIKQKYVSEGCKQFYDMMNEHITFHINLPSDYVEIQCDTLKLDKTIKNTILTIAKNVKKIGIVNGHTSFSISASCVLVVLIYNKEKEIQMNTKRTIAKQFKISEVTISKIYKKIIPYFNLLLNTEACEYVEQKLTELLFIKNGWKNTPSN